MNLSPFNVIAHIVNVLVLFFVLKRLLYQPVSKFLKERENRFQKRKEDMKVREKEIAVLKENYSNKIQSAKDEAEKIIEQATRLAEERSEEILRQARTQAQEILERAGREIELERKQTQEILKAETAVMAIEIASKVIQREISLEDNRKVIDEFLQRVG